MTTYAAPSRNRWAETHSAPLPTIWASALLGGQRVLARCDLEKLLATGLVSVVRGDRVDVPHEDVPFADLEPVSVGARVWHRWKKGNRLARLHEQKQSFDHRTEKEPLEEPDPKAPRRSARLASLESILRATVDGNPPGVTRKQLVDKAVASAAALGIKVSPSTVYNRMKDLRLLDSVPPTTRGQRHKGKRTAV